MRIFFSITTMHVHMTPYCYSQWPCSGIVGQIIANKVNVVSYCLAKFKGSLTPSEQTVIPKFLQIYFVEDEIQQANHRCSYSSQLDKHLVLSLQTELQIHNEYARTFTNSLFKISPQYQLVIRSDRTPEGEHERRYN